MRSRPASPVGTEGLLSPVDEEQTSLLAAPWPEPYIRRTSVSDGCGYLATHADLLSIHFRNVLGVASALHYTLT